ncbi:MAG TPA: type II secretion system F family protein [Jatrophihabitans sp.]|jgi:tight adherence protein B|uniref:type II secretion system F family protein n=1 Tax=Jatrophihabitans sp. TaxID=1932789 RepID=UPI002F072EAD
MTALTLLLLGTGVALVPAPAVAQRRLGWLAEARWGHTMPARPRRGSGPAWGRLISPRLGAGVAGLTLGLAAGLAAGPVPGLLAALTGTGLVRCLRLFSAERDDERCRADLAATVTALRNEYAAGATTAAAFAAAATSAGRFQPAVTRAAVLAREGDDVAPALAAEGELVRLAVACDLVRTTGAPLGRLLAGVQADLQADQRTHRAVRTALAGPRSSALLLAGLPLIGVAMGSVMGAHPERVLLHTPAGLIALSAGVVLDLAGVAWTLALSRRALA